MGKINTEIVKTKSVEMLKDLSKIANLYDTYSGEIESIRKILEWTDEYKNKKVNEKKEQLQTSAVTVFTKMEKTLDQLGEAMKANDKIYDFSDPEFMACVSLLQACQGQLPLEMVEGIAEKFLGNRQALLALSEVAKGNNKGMILEFAFLAEQEIENLQRILGDIYTGFPRNISSVPSFRSAVVKLAKKCGYELSEQETEMGEAYQNIVTMQMRAAMGLPQ